MFSRTRFIFAHSSLVLSTLAKFCCHQADNKIGLGINFDRAHKFDIQNKKSKEWIHQVLVFCALHTIRTVDKS